MPFVRLEGRKDWGITRASQTIKCYKCKKEIEMGEIFYSKKVILNIQVGLLDISVTPVTKICSLTFN